MPLDHDNVRTSTYVETSSARSLLSEGTSLPEEAVPAEDGAGAVFNYQSNDVPMSSHHHPLHRELLQSFREWTASQADSMERLNNAQRNQLDDVCQQILAAIREATFKSQDTDFDVKPVRSDDFRNRSDDFNVKPVGRLSRVGLDIHNKSSGDSLRDSRGSRGSRGSRSSRASEIMPSINEDVCINGTGTADSASHDRGKVDRSGTGTAAFADSSLHDRYNGTGTATFADSMEVLMHPAESVIGAESAIAATFASPGNLSPHVLKKDSDEKRVTLKQKVLFNKPGTASQSSLDSRKWRGVSQESLHGPEEFTMIATDSKNGPIMLNQHSRRSSRKSELAEEVLRSASPVLLSQLDDAEEQKRRNGWQQMVKSPVFDFASAIAIIAFMFMLGAETNYTAKNQGQSTSVFMIGTFLFNSWFTLELLVRIAAERLSFFTSDEFVFNIIDLILVIVSVADLILELAFKDNEHITGSVSMAKAVRVVRVMRAVRIVRLVRAMRYVYQLRKMICLIAGCFTTLFWCLIILFGFIFTFAVFFTQGVTDHLYEASVEEAASVDVLKLYYGSLPRSISSLFQSMSNGISWRDAFEPLGDVGVFYSFCFMMYMTLSLFGVVNVMTSVFVESTMKSALAYRDLITTDVERMKKITGEHLQGVFRSIDLNRDGYISIEEMVYFMADPAISGYLEALDISLHDARALFQLLDSDSSGYVDIDEFCDGCMRLKGDAKAFDVGCLICEMTRFFTRWSKFTEFVVKRFNRLERTMKLHRRGTGYEWDPESQGIPPEPHTEIPPSQHVSSGWRKPSNIVTGKGTIGL